MTPISITRRRALTTLAAAAAGPALLPHLARPATAAAPTSLPGDPGSSEHVLLVDLDGFDHRFLDGAYAHLSDLPNIRALRDSGAYGVARGSFSSYSNASRATIATGVQPRFHGNTGYFYDVDADVVVGQQRYIDPARTTLAQSLRAQGVPAAYVQWYIVENYGASYGDPLALYTQPGGDAAARVDQAMAILRGEPVESGGEQIQLPQVPRLLMVYADSIDSLLHEEGFNSPALPGLLDEVDDQVGRLLDTLAEVGLAETTTVLLTADHGARQWTKPILDELLDVIASTGFVTEQVSTGQSPSADTEIVVVGAPRTGGIALRGAADRRSVQNTLRELIGEMTGVAAVYDQVELRRIGASPKLGHLVIEPEEPYHFSTNPDGVQRASHGGLAEAEAPLIVRGPGVPAGGTIAGASFTDYAPAIHHYLGAQW